MQIDNKHEKKEMNPLEGLNTVDLLNDLRRGFVVPSYIQTLKQLPRGTVWLVIITVGEEFNLRNSAQITNPHQIINADV